MDDPTGAAIIVEGGAMRAIFAAGVLDAFAEACFFPFGLAIGASAGACLLASELANQRGRNRRVLCGPMTRPRFLNWLRFARGGHMMDLDWLWETLDREDRLDVEAATSRQGVDFRVVVTDALTGTPAYLRPCASDLNQILKASSALPGLYRGPVRVGDRLFVDGGVGDPLPVEAAYGLGARRIMAVRTRPAGSAEVSAREAWFASQVVRGYPQLARTIRRRKDAYARAASFISRPPHDCMVIEAAPPGPLRTSRTSTDQQALAADYELGVWRAGDAMSRWKTALA